MEEYKYLFSIIIPIYNRELYLEECIDSVIDQTIGFENIQLILINDGSTDKSEKICLSYKNKYPDNVVYEKKENGGVSSARNAGYKYIEGKYVTFLDSDDKFALDVCDKVYKYFEDNYNEINLVIINIVHFYEEDEAKKRLICEPKIRYIETEFRGFNGICTYFLKKDLILQYKFDEKCLIAEDMKVTDDILLNERKYADYPNAYYLYRSEDRESLSFSFPSPSIREFMYKDFIYNALEYLVKLSINLYKKVIPHIQCKIIKMIMYLGGGFQPVELYKLKCFEDIKYIMQYVDDNVILQIWFHKIWKLFLLQIKYKGFNNINNRLDIDFLKSKGFLSYDYYNKYRYNELIISNSKKFINEKNESIFGLYGQCYTNSDKLNEMYIKLNEVCYLAKIESIETINVFGWNLYNLYSFTASLDYNKHYGENVEIYLDIEGEVNQYPISLKVN